jgi:hypothetical protein
VDDKFGTYTLRTAVQVGTRGSDRSPGRCNASGTNGFTTGSAFGDAAAI